jgi:N-hydroxyarylamine O-acetyltransferase
MKATRYLDRIHYRGEISVDASCLEALTRAHLGAVPFENFDIHLGRPIRLDTPSLFHKIVDRRRGGFCYELNGLFAWLLRELGFDVELLSARVYRKGKSGQDFDHMALRVNIDDKSYLVDVGFGDGSPLPLELSAGASRKDNQNQYRLHASARGLLFEMEAPSGLVKGYELSLAARDTQDFAAMCQFHQTSVHSWFTQARICVIHTEHGSSSLIEGVLKTHGREKTSRELGVGETLEILRSQFGIDLPRMPGNKGNTFALRAQKSAFAWQSRARKAWELSSVFAGRRLAN